MAISRLPWTPGIFLETLGANRVMAKIENIQDPAELWVNGNGERGSLRRAAYRIERFGIWF